MTQLPTDLNRIDDLARQPGPLWDKLPEVKHTGGAIETYYDYEDLRLTWRWHSSTEVILKCWWWRLLDRVPVCLFAHAISLIDEITPDWFGFIPLEGSPVVQRTVYTLLKQCQRTGEKSREMADDYCQSVLDHLTQLEKSSTTD